MRKISLNFFGEKAEITLPADIKSLRKSISDQFLFSPTDAEELVISYQKDFNKILLKTESDLKVLFQLKDIKELNLDVCESSKLYQEKRKSVEEEQQVLTTALEMIKKEETELINENSKLIADAQSKQKEIKDHMRMLKDQLIKIHLDLKTSTKEIRSKIKEKRTTIKELEHQLNIPEEQRWNPIEEVKKMFTHEKRGMYGMAKTKKEKRGGWKEKIVEQIKEKNPLEEELKQFEVLKKEAEKAKKIKDNAEVTHLNVTCDGCGMKPIKGTRFKCAVCDNFDYCGNCELINANIHQHPFICIRNPKLSPTAIKCCIRDDVPEYQKLNYSNTNA